VTADTSPKSEGAALDPKRAVGRPMKAPKRGRRAPLGLLVRPQIKRLVNRLATANGTTQSAAGELLIERGLAVQTVLDAMGKTLEEVERGNVEAALWRLGYRPHREMIDGKVWKSWCEPGHPRAGEISTGDTP
jgi:hypothetical protein